MEPLDELTDECIKWLASIGSKAKLISEIIASKDSKVYKAIEDGKTFEIIIYFISEYSLNKTGLFFKVLKEQTKSQLVEQLECKNFPYYQETFR